MKLLIVEDSQTIALSLQKGLKSFGYVVDVAFDGQAGADLALSEPYDVVILDIMLPQKDGLTICREMRAANVTTPVLLLTAKGTLENKVTGFDSGADDYLVKPFEFAELLARVQALSRRPAALQASTFAHSGLLVDTKSLSVSRFGTQVVLSKREFSLLVYLLANKGQVLSKEHILQHVWEFDADVLPNTVEVYVGYLRAKLEKPFAASAQAQPLIKTVRGFGYTLV